MQKKKKKTLFFIQPFIFIIKPYCHISSQIQQVLTSFDFDFDEV